ncbi:MAG: hypothetical protein WB586_04900 [Chthoniobacterales bacterium]
MNLRSLALSLVGATALAPNLAPPQPSGPATPNVTTNLYDHYESGVNANETLLTPDNVKDSSFGLLFTCEIDGQAYAQPLYVYRPILLRSTRSHQALYNALIMRLV